MKNTHKPIQDSIFDSMEILKETGIEKVIDQHSKMKMVFMDYNENARIYIAKIATDGAQIKSCGRMCSSCAFKKDSPANLEPHNVNAAIAALEQGQFNCHIEIDVDSGSPCAGFMNALQIVDPKRKVITYTPKELSQNKNINYEV